MTDAFDATTAVLVSGDDLAIEHGVSRAEMCRYLVREHREPVERVATARNQPIAPALDIAKAAKSDVLDLEHPLGMVERSLRRVGLMA